jgi:hypothetical protein
MAVSAASQDVQLKSARADKLDCARFAAKLGNEEDSPERRLRESFPSEESCALSSPSGETANSFDGLRLVTPSLYMMGDFAPDVMTGMLSIAPESIQLKRALKLKKVLRCGATWLESQQAFAHDTILAAEVDILPTRHGRGDGSAVPFTGVFAAEKKPRIHISIGGEMVRMAPTSLVSYVGHGESWRLDPRHPDPHNADDEFAGRVSAQPRLEHMSSASRGAWQRQGHERDASRSRSAAGVGHVWSWNEDGSRTKARRRGAVVERPGAHDESSRAAHSGLVGGSLPSLLRDGFRSRAGKKLETLAKLSRDASVSTHGSYQASTTVSSFLFPAALIWMCAPFCRDTFRRASGVACTWR